MPPKRNHHRNRKEVVENAMSDCFLPLDVMLSILARLPVKSLVRFQCVCKPWNNLVSNPKFIKIHTDLFPQSPKTYSVQPHVLKCSILGLEPTKLDLDNSVEFFFESCKGLICVGRPLFTKEVVLWNPATRLWKTLPHSKADYGVADMVSLGFGCNQDGDDFKVVRIFCLRGKKMRVRVEVYSSKSDSWKTMEVGFKFRVLYPKNHAIVNGNPYWCAEIDEKTIEGEDRAVWLGFHATEMAFKIVPTMGEGDSELQYVDWDQLGGPLVDWEGSLGGLMCVRKNDDDDRREWIDVFVYDDGEGVWRRKERFGPIELQVDQLLECSRNGMIVGGSTNGKPFLFDPKKKCVSVSELKRGKSRCFQILTYNESLAHVKGMKPMVVNKGEEEEEADELMSSGFFVSRMNHRSRELWCHYPLAY